MCKNFLLAIFLALCYNFFAMKKVFEDNNINISNQAEKHFLLFCDTLLEKNKQFNLTAIREKQEVYEKHFADSLMGKDYFTAGAKILEVGSGGGFPSVPLKIENIGSNGQKMSFFTGNKKAVWL